MPSHSSIGSGSDGSVVGKKTKRPEQPNQLGVNWVARKTSFFFSFLFFLFSFALVLYKRARAEHISSSLWRCCISVEIKQIIAAQKVVIFPQSSLTVDRERVTILHSTGSDESTPCISELGPGEGLDFNLGRRVQNPMLGRRTPTGQSEAERTRKRPTQRHPSGRSTFQNPSARSRLLHGPTPFCHLPHHHYRLPSFVLYLPASLLLPCPTITHPFFLRSPSVTLLSSITYCFFPLRNGSSTSYRFVRTYA